jgi:hypothetical protein
VTKDECIKILDFGLAKLRRVKSASSDDPTITIPQQTDPRQVLYEMLTGKPAFRKATSAEICEKHDLYGPHPLHSASGDERTDQPGEARVSPWQHRQKS